MCGRFVASRPVEDIARLLEVDELDFPPELAVPRWNVAPQAMVLAVTSSREKPVLRRLSAFRWGLVPWWAKDPSIGSRAFNAKSETVEEKPMFRGAIARQRCVIPADAFYEWAAATGDSRRRKQPWCFRSADSGLLLFGGLFERWRPPEAGGAAAVAPEAPLRTCTVLTTEANELVGRVHNRMPVLIAERDLDQWLAREPLGADELAALTRPAPDAALEAFRVSTRVNDARDEGPGLLEPIVDGEDGVRLF